MQAKEIMASYQLIKQDSIYRIEGKTPIEEGVDVVFVSMIIELLVRKYNVTNDQMAKALLDGIEAHPLEFDLVKEDKKK
ncbi:hypothetical protein [Melissococcus plutonius]|uniref:hypothetical protein n=1 Tax=Melissococcus plutonius TaxID=33970 RepID=UPI0021E595B1|nr:hypothetical protein [Melissococcus plutonius]MCV2499589.1 hypothetical protein [Melissococcus plutonius]MCV2501731.1 hypothetical protein [Melissococcus plutonius]MCV2505959.1 hypothetical protein [Melissococcus plutonius]MCV2508201.1 hypothetical protein [Melissococcus plutonius]MCV2528023.1 hypothetical protein [Melissococcus plutonius]